MDGKSHEVATPTKNVHDVLAVPLDAVTVTVSPGDPPEMPKVGVTSLVTSSEFDEPVSETSSKSTPEGGKGEVASIRIDNDPDDEPMLPAMSTKDADTVHTPSPSVGNAQLVATPTV